jgi:hypothetical protein
VEHLQKVQALARDMMGGGKPDSVMSKASNKTEDQWAAKAAARTSKKERQKKKRWVFEAMSRSMGSWCNYKTLCPNDDTWKDKSQLQKQGEE